MLAAGMLCQPRVFGASVAPMTFRLACVLLVLCSGSAFATVSRQGDTADSQALSYDVQNRLKVFSQAGSLVVEYGCAADGARLWKRVNQNATNLQVRIGNTYEDKGGRTLFYVFAGGQ